MHRYIEHLKRTKKDLEENLEKYLEELKKLATEKGGRLHIFGSFALGKSIGASEVDVLIEIPDCVDRFEVLHEARKLVTNRRFETTNRMGKVIEVLNEDGVFKPLEKVNLPEKMRGKVIIEEKLMGKNRRSAGEVKGDEIAVLILQLAS
jgi:predicted DNA-binding antitoxin AbrB/MazE fold protein